MSRNIHEAAARLKDATPEEIQLIAKHDWDMIRDVAAFAIALGSQPAAPREDAVRAVTEAILKWRIDAHDIKLTLAFSDIDCELVARVAIAALPRPAVSGWRTHKVDIIMSKGYYTAICSCGFMDGPWAGRGNAESAKRKHEEAIAAHVTPYLSAAPSPSAEGKS